jgi:hypothetical protein
VSSSTERQRRLRERRRLHAKDDHSKCLPTDRCKAGEGRSEPDGDAGAGVTGDVTPPSKNQPSHRPPPAGLGERGQRLWDEMAGLTLNPTHVLLLERCCRKADRLEEMDEARRGRGWIHLVEVPNTDSVLEVRVDKLLSEIRQTEVALKLDVAELRHAGRPANGTAGTPPTGTPTEPTRGADDDDDEPRTEWPANVTSIAGIAGIGS